MSRTNGAPRAELSAWGVENLRLTTFHQTIPKAEGWWQQSTGHEPDSTAAKKGGERAEIGSWEGMMLALQVQPVDNRVDWLLSGLVADLENSPPPLTEKLPTFTALLNRWLAGEHYPQPTTRMAFGAVISLATTDTQEGYRRLSDYLPFDIDRTTSSDFFYQINRQRDSVAVSGLRINRLTKWTVGITIRRTMQLSSEGLAIAAGPDTLRCGCRVELDISTMPQAGNPLPHNQLSHLLGEMVTLAEELVREGDIP